MNIAVSDEHPSSGVDHSTIRSWAESTLEAEGYPPATEVSLVLVPDERMAQWNQEAMGHAGPTDVLSFPIEPLLPGVSPQGSDEGPPLMIGDVVIAPDYVRRQAEELEVEADDEMALMVTHGILHLLGYDHVVDEEAERMEAREREILEAMGRRRR